jgi:hypothetical protein
MLRWGALLLTLTGCADVIGLSELAFDRPDAPGGGGGTGGGGMGGLGGGGGAAGEGGTPLPCPGYQFGDDFEDGRVASAWDAFETKGSVVESGGVLAMDSTDVGASLRLETDDGYDAPLGWIEVEIVRPVADATAAARLTMACATGTVVLSQLGDELLFTRRNGIGEDILWQGPFDPVDDRHIRLRERETQRIVETSPDGAEWTARATLAEGTLPALEDVLVSLGLDANTDARVGATFDNLEICSGR